MVRGEEPSWRVGRLLFPAALFSFQRFAVRVLGRGHPRRISALYTAVGWSRRRGRAFDIPAVCLPPLRHEGERKAVSQ